MRVDGDDRLDIVNVDFVAASIVTLHQKERPNHSIYHLASGTDSQTYRELTRALSEAQRRRSPFFAPGLQGPFTSVVNWLANRRGTVIGHGASLMKVFIPYLVYNTVFDNTRAGPVLKILLSTLEIQPRGAFHFSLQGVA